MTRNFDASWGRCGDYPGVFIPALPSLPRPVHAGNVTLKIVTPVRPPGGTEEYHDSAEKIQGKGVTICAPMSLK